MDRDGQDNPFLGRRQAMRGAGAAALAGGFAALAARAAGAQQAQPGAWVAGVWRTFAGGGPNRAQVQAVDLFLPGGIYLRLDSPVEEPAGPARGPEALEYAAPFAGEWAQLPSGEVRVTAMQLNYDRRAAVTSVEWLFLALTSPDAGRMNGT